MVRKAGYFAILCPLRVALVKIQLQDSSQLASILFREYRNKLFKRFQENDVRI